MRGRETLLFIYHSFVYLFICRGRESERRVCVCKEAPGCRPGQGEREGDHSVRATYRKASPSVRERRVSVYGEAPGFRLGPCECGCEVSVCRGRERRVRACKEVQGFRPGPGERDPSACISRLKAFTLAPVRDASALFIYHIITFIEPQGASYGEQCNQSPSQFRADRPQSFKVYGRIEGHQRL